MERFRCTEKVWEITIEGKKRLEREKRDREKESEEKREEKRNNGCLKKIENETRKKGKEMGGGYSLVSDEREWAKKMALSLFLLAACLAFNMESCLLLAKGVLL